MRQPAFSKSSPPPRGWCPPIQSSSAPRSGSSRSSRRSVASGSWSASVAPTLPRRNVAGRRARHWVPGTPLGEPLAKLAQDRSRYPVAFQLGHQLLLLSDREPGALRVAPQRLRSRRGRSPQKVHDLQPPSLPWWAGPRTMPPARECFRTVHVSAPATDPRVPRAQRRRSRGGRTASRLRTLAAMATALLRSSWSGPKPGSVGRVAVDASRKRASEHRRYGKVMAFYPILIRALRCLNSRRVFVK